MSGNVEQGPAGRVAVITGASRGLGAGLAARFAEAGLRLGLCARQEPSPPAGAEAVTASVDVTEAGAVDRFAGAVVDRFGRVDLWINNAGLLRPVAPLREADAAELEAHVRTNVLGVIYGSRAFARHVRGRLSAGGDGPGVLVNITSGAATSVYQGWSAYCGSKAAVDHITRVVAAEEAEAGLRAFAVAPGVVDTDMQALIRATPPDAFPEVERFHRLAETGAFNSPSWVADHILALAFGESAEPPDVVWRIPAEPHAG